MGTNRWMPLIAPTSATTACTDPGPRGPSTRAPGRSTVGQDDAPRLGVERPARAAGRPHRVRARRPRPPGRSPAATTVPPGPTTRTASSTSSTLPAREARSTHPESTTAAPAGRRQRAQMLDHLGQGDRDRPVGPRPSASAAHTAAPRGSTASTATPAPPGPGPGRIAQLAHHHRQAGVGPEPARRRTDPHERCPGRRGRARPTAIPRGSSGALEPLHPGRQEPDGVERRAAELGRGPRRPGRADSATARSVYSLRSWATILTTSPEHPFAGLGAPAALPQVGGQPTPGRRGARRPRSARPAGARRRRSSTAGCPAGASRSNASSSARSSAGNPARAVDRRRPRRPVGRPSSALRSVVRRHRAPATTSRT